MTAWQNLKINSLSHLMDSMHEFKKNIPKVIHYLNKNITNILQKNEDDFIRVSIQKNQIIFNHIKGESITNQASVNIEELSATQVPSFVLSNSFLPLQISIDCEDVTYKIISLNQTKWWNRYGLFNQISIAEFEEEDWTYSEYVPSPYDRFRHLFIGFRPTQHTLDAFSFIKTLKNPVAKIQLSSINQTMTANTYLQKHNYLQTSYQWVLFIRKVSSTEWLLSAQQYGAILLTRRGLFHADKTEEESIDAEINTTLRYLHRAGYEQNNELALMSSGFSDVFNNYYFKSANISNLIAVPTQVIDKHLYSTTPLNTFVHRNFYVITKFLSFFKFTVQPYKKEFKPSSMTNQRLAYWLPIWARQLIIPSFILCAITITNTYKIYDLNAKISENTLKAKTIQPRIGNTARQQEVANYNVINELPSENPIMFLKTLSSSLSKNMHITDFSWSASTTTPNQPFFEATVHYTDTNHTNNRKHKKTKKVPDKTKVITSKLKYHYPNIVVKIEPKENKSTYKVGISWE